MWRCASMKPGIAVMPFASIVLRPWVAAPADTDTILPARTITVPELITLPLPATMRAFVIATS
jgi:hypothetical protein